MTRHKKVTISQVAQRAGVSSTTVSLVLNGPESGGDRISPETRRRVMAAIAELEYFPNQAARSLRRRNTERVCLAFNDLGIPFNDLLAKEVFRTAHEMGYMAIIALTNSREQEYKALDQMMRGLADGIIFISPSYLTGEDLSRLARGGCAVCVSSNHLLPEGVDVVQSTEEEAAWVAMERLYARGHRRIAYIGRVLTNEIPFPRYRAYRQFLASRGLPVEEGYVQPHSGVSRDEAYRKARQMLALERPPTAIFAGSDLAAISAMYAVQERGLRIPEDVAVIGSGNLPEGAIVRPPLTTIGPVKIDFGPLVNFLFSRLRGEAPPEGRVERIQWMLIERESA